MSVLLDPYKVREDFPILAVTHPNGRRIVYLDNAATTHKPVQVVERIAEVYRSSYSNVHRSGHYLARRASTVFEEFRGTMRRFLGARKDSEIVFAWNTTFAINAIALPLLEVAKREGKTEVVTTVMEHHSNILPWRRAARILGMAVRYVPVDGTGRLRYDVAEELVGERTAVVTVTHASNVTGIVNDVRSLARLAKRYGAYVVVDGAQYAPHRKVNVMDLEVDFYAVSGHKMLGPEGTGALYGREDVLGELVPLIVGGGTVARVTLDDVDYLPPPSSFEAGTPNIAGAAGLAEAVMYLERLGMENVEAHERRLLELLYRRMKELDDVKVYGLVPPDGKTAVLSFNLGNQNPHVVGTLLDEEYGIAVRTGMHCAHPYHLALGAVEGTVRASFYIYNTPEEAEYFVDSLADLEKLLRESG